jgi:hypothetical protein
MKYLFLIALLCASLFASAQDKTAEPTVHDGKLKWFAIGDTATTEKPYATFYVYRNFVPVLVSNHLKMPIKVDGVLMHELKLNSMVSFRVYTMRQIKVSADKRNKKVVLVDIEPGKNYFFRCTMPTDLLSAPKSIIQIEETQARAYLNLPADR